MNQQVGKQLDQRPTADTWKSQCQCLGIRYPQALTCSDVTLPGGTLKGMKASWWTRVIYAQSLCCQWLPPLQPGEGILESSVFFPLPSSPPPVSTDVTTWSQPLLLHGRNSPHLNKGSSPKTQLISALSTAHFRLLVHMAHDPLPNPHTPHGHQAPSPPLPQAISPTFGSSLFPWSLNPWAFRMPCDQLESFLERLCRTVNMQVVILL